MKVLVVVASKHGSTREMADAIGAAVAACGGDVTVAPIDGDAPAVAGYDAVILGSAVYVGHWLDAAQRFVEEHREDLVARPVWLFSSGPVGSPLKPDDVHSVDVSAVMEATGAREHRLFAGRLDKSRLGFGERAIMLAVRAAEGDYRDWDDIRAWATGIGETLGREPRGG